VVQRLDSEQLPATQCMMQCLTAAGTAASGLAGHRRRVSVLCRHVSMGAASAGAAPFPCDDEDDDDDYRVGEAFLSWNAADAVQSADIQPRWLCSGDGDQADTLSYTRNGDELVVLNPAQPQEPLVVGVAALAAMLSADPSELKIDMFRLASPTTVILAHGGDAFMCELVGGTAKKLPGLSGLPATLAAHELMSPDGRLALFAKDQNLCIRGHLADGSFTAETLLTSDGSLHAAYGSLTCAHLPCRRARRRVVPFDTECSREWR
jgi:hypothetical protein